MSMLSILTYPDPVLHQVSLEVTDFTKETQKFLDDLAETMKAAQGIGLASPQVGILKRMVVIDVSQESSERIDFVNPEIVWANGTVDSEEGCLSIPQYRDKVKRNKELVVQAKDRYGKEFEISADGLLAICIQHEVDHLNGILFIDRLSFLKRGMFKRWYKKNLLKQE